MPQGIKDIIISTDTSYPYVCYEILISHEHVITNLVSTERSRPRLILQLPKGINISPDTSYPYVWYGMLISHERVITNIVSNEGSRPWFFLLLLGKYKCTTDSINPRSVPFIYATSKA